MSHDHHDHHHAPVLTQISRAFVVGIVLNLAFVILEAIVGLATHSLALLTDAGHNLSDVASLGLSLLAFRLAKTKRTATFTYGYQKTTIIAALTNAVILLIAIGGIAWEAIQRLRVTEEVQGGTVAIVALVGIVINAVTAFLFFRQKDADLNVKGAYLHLAADAAVSLGVVIGGIVMLYTHWYWLDAALSIVIAIVIFISTWKLLKQTLRLSLDGVPEGIDLAEITTAALAIEGVTGIQHIHVWAISTSQNALTAHLIIRDYARADAIKQEFRHALQHLDIHHSNLETETAAEIRADDTCGLH